MIECTRAPNGWFCTREEGHDGPCATWPGKRPTTEIINYGENRTIHGTTHLDIEQDSQGNVVSVWFRCIGLPFQTTIVREERAAEMRMMSKKINDQYKIHAMKVETPKSW